MKVSDVRNMNPSNLRMILDDLNSYINDWGLDKIAGVIDIHVGYILGKHRALHYGATIQVSEDLFRLLAHPYISGPRVGFEVHRRVEHKNLYREVYPTAFIKVYCCRSIQKEYDSLATEIIYERILAEE